MIMKAEISKELCTFLTDMEKDLDDANQEAIQRRYITSVVIRISMIVLIFLGLANVYLLDLLNTGLSSTLANADNISKEFSSIGQDMALMTRSVKGMDNEMQALTGIAGSMATISNNMGLMTFEMHNIANVVTGIENSVGHVDKSMNHVEHSMQDVSNNMYFISEDMHRMAKPVGWMNNILPW